MGRMTAHPADELVENDQDDREQRVLPKPLGVAPEQDQHDEPELVDAHKERVAAEAKLGERDAPVTASEAFEAGGHH
eukprot:scaffold159593_cov32-Tisochrysis_lutea.AAC.4